MKDYKDTIILPKTSFPMRANLQNKEQEKYRQWLENKIYEKVKNNRKNAKKSFTLHDGPPYANGHLHIGHALNKILKDIVNKHHYFKGEAIRYVPGWDCHGLPIEQQVEKKIKGKKDDLPKSKLRELCQKHAREFIDIQKQEFQALGVLADFENGYETMDYEFEANIYKVLCEVAKKGILIQRNKPVYWSWACQSALAEAEVEYQDKISDSIYVAFSLQKKACEALKIKQAKIIIWTTTPWTLPANVAIALNPDEKYILSDDGFISAKKLYEELKNQDIIKGDIALSFDSSTLEGLLATNPLNNKNSKIILGEHVQMSSGSGCVHTAPGHGEDDYKMALKYNLDMIMPVDDKGCYDNSIASDNLIPNAKDFVGLNVLKANEKILEVLGDSILKHSQIKHSYPHCWRSHTPIIFRATKQWFIALDKVMKGENKTLRQIAYEQIQKVKFYPQSGKNRLLSMIKNRPDWCISRQRDWGIPIAFFEDIDTKEIIFDEEVLKNIKDIFAQKGCGAWWDLSINELLPNKSEYKKRNLRKINHILDVWFDSGSTWECVLNSDNYDAGDYPASMYLEGSDQHRGWFQSSFLISCILNAKAPFKSILTHGFTVDKNAQKMSKSKGNVILPSKVIKEFGAEILRLWVALSDYSNDLKISKEILAQVSEQYRKIRNTIRFLLANSDGLDKLCPKDEFGELDKWILTKAHNAFSVARSHFDDYEFAKGLNIVIHFITKDLSGIYLDVCKDSLYCDSQISNKRIAIQSTMVILVRSLCAFIAPILTYSANEALTHATKVIKQDCQDIFDITYQDIEPMGFEGDFDYLISLRDILYEKIDTLKKDKIIKSTLEIFLITDDKKVLSYEEAADFFIISKAHSKSDSQILDKFEHKGNTFCIAKSDLFKCPRCWKYNALTQSALCDRCNEVVKA